MASTLEAVMGHAFVLITHVTSLWLHLRSLCFGRRYDFIRESVGAALGVLLKISIRNNFKYELKYRGVLCSEVSKGRG